MPHPFFDALKFPIHRQDAQAFHRALYEVITTPQNIELNYRRCAEGLPPLTPGVPANAMWLEALDNLTTARALQKLCEMLLQTAALAAMHPLLRAVHEAVDPIGEVLADGKVLFLDRSRFRNALDRLRVASGTERVLLIRGGAGSGKSWSKQMVELVAVESGAGTIFVAEGLVAGVEDMVAHLFTCLEGPEDVPAKTSTDDAWYMEVCRKLLVAARRSKKPRWIIVDDLGQRDGAPLLDAKIKAFFDQLGLFMSNEEFRRWLRLVLIDYPDGKLPTRWTQKFINVVEDRTAETDIMAAHVEEYLRAWARRRQIALADDDATRLAGDVITYADAEVAKGPGPDGERPVRLQLIHNKVLEVVTVLQGAVS